VARLTPTDWKTLKCIFEHAGFSFEREKGDHIVLSRPGTPRPVIIPKYSSIGLDINRCKSICHPVVAGVVSTYAKESNKDEAG